MKDVNVKLFNVITRINEAKSFVTHISRYCECKFNTITSNTNQKWNKGKCQCVCKKYCTCKKDYS